MTSNIGDSLGRWATARRATAITLVVAGVAIGAVLAAGGTHAAGLTRNGEAERIGAALTRTFATQDCLVEADATQAVRAILDAEGGVDWAVESAGGASGGVCVSAGIAADDRIVVLIPGARGTVVQTTSSIAGELMARCLGRDDAIRYVSSTLAAIGVVDASVRTDGPFAFPDGEEAAVRAHVAAGCYVWSGSGHDAGGQPVYYLFGPGA